MHPILTEIPGPWGSFTVYAFGACLGAGLLVGWLSFSRSAEKSGRFDEGARATRYVSAVIGALIGGGLVTGLLGAWGGFAHGELARSATVGALSGTIGMALTWKKGTRGIALDMLAPAIALGYAWVQLGWYLDGSAYGTPLDSSAPQWLTSLGTFPEYMNPGSGAPTGLPLAFADQVRSGQVVASAGASIPLHPVQLYEVLWALVVGGLSMGLSPRSPRAGAGATVTILLLALGALALSPYHHGGGLTGGYALPGLSAGVILASVFAYVWLRREDPAQLADEAARQPSL